MAQKYFRCEPTKLCEGATCCRTIDTQPALGIGDYLRLSEYTGEPITQIWRDKGDVSLTTFDDLRMGEFVMSLSLLHDPCPYLSDDDRCEVHESRPHGCATFPIFVYECHPEQLKTAYKDYRCLKNVKLRPQQRKLHQSLSQIIKKEAAADNKFLWSDNPYIYIPSMEHYSQLAVQALQLQQKRDPQLQSERTPRLLAVVDEMRSLMENGEAQKGFKGSLFVHLCKPMVYSLLEDQVAEILDNLDSEALETYRKTTEEMKKLIGRVE